MACPTGKIGYASAVAAHKAVAAMPRNKSRSERAATAGWQPGKSSAYRCEFCGQYHIGHATPKPKKVSA